MRLLRLLWLILHLFRGLATCALIFPFVDVRGREHHIRRWSHALLRICRVELRVIRNDEAEDLPRALIVANHHSWLDIFVINAMHPCRFVAKSEIRKWPLIGWLCEQVGTIFIERGRLRDVRRIYQGLVESLHAGEHVAFFPEGTVSEQGSLHPFHANLFEAAIEAAVPVQPFALRYLDRAGNYAESIRYVVPITFPQSLWMILGGPPIVAELRLLAPIPTPHGAHRRDLANAARAAIAPALGIPTAEVQTEPGA
ncbi:MAG TPA: lysophospholipid acyltransferase family protein [Noviherbaspirillum sp.]|nr:lysophospholipid acyltransferase family protein [Noviherbaspirillum sp.]